MKTTRKAQFDSRFEIIENDFDQLPFRSFPEKFMQDYFNDNYERLQIPLTKYSRHFIQQVLRKGIVATTSFNDQNNNQKIVYTWKSNDELTVMSGLKLHSYFSHYTAMFLHQLTLQIPKTYYLNYEHTKDTIPSDEASLTQEAIDRVFSNPQRKASQYYSLMDRKIFILNGKKTNKLGVIKVLNEKQCYEYTDLERTLIDIAIRPVYAGGVFEVLEAYKKAKDILDVKKLVNYLDKLNFIYPYHQVIGFYLERAGYSEKNLKLFDKKKLFDFYLTYEIRNKEYSSRWKLHIPKGI